jgi:alkanesulfonate monooxygenase SsuD/methylene tetrahydromethanopterin reductase-like flavin-dependent oxidoreductase (luciferase family)
MLDEGLEILDGLWSGEPFEFHGDHYDLERVTFLPRPVQRPRVQVWVAAMWPRKRPLRRAAHWDGIAPLFYSFDRDESLEPTPERLSEVTAYVSQHRDSGQRFDVAVSTTHIPGVDATATVEALEAAGATWWRDGWVPDVRVEPGDWIASVLEGPPVH